MLKHCHSSSVRLQRRYNTTPQADSVSLNSNVTVRSHGDSSDSSLNSSFNMNTGESHHEVFNVRNALYDRSVYGFTTPDPISLSSRTSSYTSLADSGPKTVIKVFASCLRPDLEYKTLSVGATTTARDVIWQLLSKFRMKHRDPKLFFLTMEVVIQKPGRDGLTKKTLVLEEDSRPAELKNCNPWGECRFTLQMRKGGLVKIYDSVLMEESQYKCLLISEDTCVEDVIKILLYCYGLEKVERADRYSIYEQCSSQRYQRKLSDDDKPLVIQSLWPGPTPFNFVLRRSPARLEDNLWSKQRVEKLSAKTNTPANSKPAHTDRAWPVVSEWSTQTEEEGIGSSPRVTSRLQGSESSRQIYLETEPSGNIYLGLGHPEFRFQSSGSSRSVREARLLRERFPSCSRIFREEDESWPEMDKDSEEHVSSGEDMDTSLSSNDSPTPPLTSTPVCISIRCPGTSRPPVRAKPKMSFLYPSPEYESFPLKSIPSRPYSSLSSSTPGPQTLASAPSLPPKPASLVSLFSRDGSSGFHDYENYFYI